MQDLKVIAFDADDTLWVNEPYFQKAEKAFCDMLEDFLPHHSVGRELLTIEIANLPLYGYGVKAFTLSMIETAIRISDGNIGTEVVDKCIEIGKTMLDEPIVLIDGIEDVLQDVRGKYRLVMLTKGDLLDQERKLAKSGLERYFHHTEIVSDKKEADYDKIIRRLDIEPQQFLMIGNSLKSDVIPVLNLGGFGFHVPFHTTWAHERVEVKVEHPNFRQLQSIKEVPGMLGG
ncbi:MAG: HAD family hydrolase [Bacteroidota bacterium]